LILKEKIMALPHIVVLGGGFGGLESAYYLRKHLTDRARITIISDRDYFLFKPNTIYIPFGLDPERLKVDIVKPASRRSISFVQDRVLEIDPVQKRVVGQRVTTPYDYLIVATGASMRPAEIPGLQEYAQTIWTPEEMLKLRAALDELRVRANDRIQKIVFMVPPNNKCAGPLYEMVFMIDTWLRQHHLRERTTITWTTYENSYIQAFGPRLHEVAENEFVQRGIAHHVQYAVERVEPHEVIYQNGQSVPFDLLISFPPYVAATQFDSLPIDERGFITTELGTRQVKGHPEIYAAGDAGDFPIKQAFLAFLEADAVAEHLSATILGKQPSKLFEPTSMCVMEQFDKATFAQVPLQVNSGLHVMVDSPQYRTGTSPVWRLGKSLLGAYLPWRFGNGQPFHDGLPWKGMEIGLKLMSSTMAN
jgi:sulfide:quinone oxidoreductase